MTVRVLASEGSMVIEITIMRGTTMLKSTMIITMMIGIVIRNRICTLALDKICIEMKRIPQSNNPQHKLHFE